MVGPLNWIRNHVTLTHFRIGRGHGEFGNRTVAPTEIAIHNSWEPLEEGDQSYKRITVLRQKREGFTALVNVVEKQYNAVPTWNMMHTHP